MKADADFGDSGEIVGRRRRWKEPDAVASQIKKAAGSYRLHAMIDDNRGCCRVGGGSFASKPPDGPRVRIARALVSRVKPER